MKKKNNNKKQKEIYAETIYHEKVTETYVADILQDKIYCGVCIYLKTTIKEVI